MSDWNPRLRRLALTLWLGGQWMVGWGVAPILFAQLDSQLAGALAGRMFSLVEWLGLGCALVWLGLYTLRYGLHGHRHALARLVWAMLACSLLNQWLIHPVINQLKLAPVDAAGQASQMLGLGFGPWHGISSSVYLLQSVLGAVWVLWRERR